MRVFGRHPSHMQAAQLKSIRFCLSILLEEAGIRLQKNKWAFWLPKVQYLGHAISQQKCNPSGTPFVLHQSGLWRHLELSCGSPSPASSHIPENPKSDSTFLWTCLPFHLSWRMNPWLNMYQPLCVLRQRPKSIRLVPVSQRIPGTRLVTTDHQLGTVLLFSGGGMWCTHAFSVSCYLSVCNQAYYIYHWLYRCTLWPRMYNYTCVVEWFCWQLVPVSLTLLHMCV